MNKTCPDTCPICGSDLKVEGYPLSHQHADTGKTCRFTWDYREALRSELDDEYRRSR
jgi:hypothetical protein